MYYVSELSKGLICVVVIVVAFGTDTGFVEFSWSFLSQCLQKEINMPGSLEHVKLCVYLATVCENWSKSDVNGVCLSCM